ncbi:MAG: DUF2934 domain-containing protein [Planctomycetia bacterium]
MSGIFSKDKLFGFLKGRGGNVASSTDPGYQPPPAGVPKARPTAAAPVVDDGELFRRIEQKAYFLWIDAGRPHGREHDFWSAAESAVRSERR